MNSVIRHLLLSLLILVAIESGLGRPDAKPLPSLHSSSPAPSASSSTESCEDSSIAPAESSTSGSDSDSAASNGSDDADDGEDALEKQWAAFKDRHGKCYNDTHEDKKRKGHFLNAKSLIDAHNARYERGEETYQMALNHLSDLSEEEFQKRNGLKKSLIEKYPCPAHGANASSRVKRGALPASLDWRDSGYVTPVKDQGQCGDCWAFSATGALEAQHFAATGQLPSLSEQNLMDCSGAYGNDGCDGGIMTAAFQYIACNGGVDSEASYPYQEVQSSCAYNKRNNASVASGYVLLPENDESALKTALATIGPISVVFDAENAFQNYASGIFSSTKCSQTNINHALLLVGYGKSASGTPYWIIKNSWGTSWGIDGYAKIARNQNTCGIASYSSYPVLGGSVDDSQCQ